MTSKNLQQKQGQLLQTGREVKGYPMMNLSVPSAGSRQETGTGTKSKSGSDYEEMYRQLLKEKEGWQRKEAEYEAQMAAMSDYIEQSQLQDSFSDYVQRSVAARPSTNSMFSPKWRGQRGSIKDAGNAAEVFSDDNAEAYDLVGQLQFKQQPYGASKRNNQLTHSQTFPAQHSAGLEIHEKQPSFDFSETEIQRVQQPPQAAPYQRPSVIADDLLFDAEEKESQLSFRRDEAQECDAVEQKTQNHSLISLTELIKKVSGAGRDTKSIFRSPSMPRNDRPLVSSKTEKKISVKTQRPARSGYLKYLRGGQAEALRTPQPEALKFGMEKPASSIKLMTLSKPPSPAARRPYTSRPKSNLSGRSRNSGNSTNQHQHNQTVTVAPTESVITDMHQPLSRAKANAKSSLSFYEEFMQSSSLGGSRPETKRVPSGPPQLLSPKHNMSSQQQLLKVQRADRDFSGEPMDAQNRFSSAMNQSISTHRQSKATNPQIKNLSKVTEEIFGSIVSEVQQTPASPSHTLPANASSTNYRAADGVASSLQQKSSEEGNQYQAPIEDDDDQGIQRYSLQGSSNNLTVINKRHHIQNNSVFKVVNTPNKRTKVLHQHIKSMSEVYDSRKVRVNDRMFSAEHCDSILVDESNKSFGSSQNSDQKSSANLPNQPNIANASSNYGFRVGKAPIEPTFQPNQPLFERQFKSQVVFATPQLSHRRMGSKDNFFNFNHDPRHPIAKQDSDPMQQKILMDSFLFKLDQPHRVSKEDEIINKNLANAINQIQQQMEAKPETSRQKNLPRAQTSAQMNEEALETAPLKERAQSEQSASQSEADDMLIHDEIKLNDIQRELFENTNKRAFLAIKPLKKDLERLSVPVLDRSDSSWLLVPGLKEGDENVRDSIVAVDTQRSHDHYVRFSTLENQSCNRTFQVKNRVAGSHISNMQLEQNEVQELPDQENNSDKSNEDLLGISKAAFKEDDDFNDREDSDPELMENLFNLNLTRQSKSRETLSSPYQQPQPQDKDKKSDDSDVVSSKSLEQQFSSARAAITSRIHAESDFNQIDSSKYFSKSEAIISGQDSIHNRRLINTQLQDNSTTPAHKHGKKLSLHFLHEIDKKSPISISVTPVDDMKKLGAEPLSQTHKNFVKARRGMTLKVKKDEVSAENQGFESQRDSNVKNDEFGRISQGAEEHMVERKTMTMRNNTIFRQQQRKATDQTKLMASVVGPLALKKLGSIDHLAITNFQKSRRFDHNHQSLSKLTDFNQRSQKKLGLNPSKGQLIKGTSHEVNYLLTQANVEPTRDGMDFLRRSETFDLDEIVDENTYRSRASTMMKDIEIPEFGQQQVQHGHNESLTFIKEDEESQIPINRIHYNHLEQAHVRNEAQRQPKQGKLLFSLNDLDISHTEASPTQRAAFGHGRISVIDALPATKGTQFQSSMKFKENLEVRDGEHDQDGTKQYLMTQPINKSLHFTKQTSELAQYAQDTRQPLDESTFVKILNTEQEEDDLYVLGPLRFGGSDLTVLEPNLDHIRKQEQQKRQSNEQLLETFGQQALKQSLMFSDQGLLFQPQTKKHLQKFESYRDADDDNLAEGHCQTILNNNSDFSYIQDAMKLHPSQASPKPDLASRIDAKRQRNMSKLDAHNALKIKGDNQILYMKPRRNEIQIKSYVESKVLEFSRVRASKSQRLFEMFFVVGITNQDLEGIEPVTDFNRQTPDESFFQEDSSVVAKEVFRFPQKAADIQVQKRSNVIQDFAFPNGVKFRKLNSMRNEKITETLQNMLFMIPKNRKNSYIFTLDANMEANTNISGVDNYFNILCVKFDTLLRRESDGEVFIVEQAFCMLSKNSFFHAQFEVLDTLLKVINNNQRIRMDLGLVESFLTINYEDDRTYYSIQKLYNQDIMANQDSKSQYPLGFKFDLVINTYVPNFDESISNPFCYGFPDRFQDCYSFSFMWHVPVMLSLFQNFRIVLRLVTAIFLERSIIFISKNPAKLSSVILGLKSMIKPFSWCGTLIPVLPGALLEIIDSPMPILVGITQESYDQLREDYELDEELVESKTWVHLDNYDPRDSRFMNESRPEFQKAEVEWCTGAEAISFDEYLWQQEYPRLDEMVELHEQFLKLQMPYEQQTTAATALNEDVHFEQSEAQSKLVKQIYEKYNEMITNQILRYIDIDRLKAVYEAEKDSGISLEKLFVKAQETVIAECQNPMSSERNGLSLNKVRSLRTPHMHEKIPELPVLAPSNSYDPERENRHEDEDDSTRSNEEVLEFMKSLVQTQSFAQFVEHFSSSEIRINVDNTSGNESPGLESVVLDSTPEMNIGQKNEEDY